jgi:RNA polymerase sigma-70 factor, ECF subfamily
MESSRKIQILEEMVREHQARLRSYVCSRTGNAEVADDVVQDVFLIAYRKIETLDLKESLFPWLLTVARSQLRQRWRSQEPANLGDKIRSLVCQRLEQESANESGSTFSEHFDQLKKCVERLPDKLRTLIDLVYHQDKTCDEASAAAGMNGTAVRVALHRARKALRECVESSLGGAHR